MIRPARASDMQQITHVRTHVVENHLSVEQMAARGITQESVWADIAAGHLGAWVAEADGRVVAFSMADRRRGNIFALFVLPAFEGRGFGTALIAACEAWLFQQGWVQAHLDTGINTKAAAFYAKRGWELVTRDEQDQFYRKVLGQQEFG